MIKDPSQVTSCHVVSNKYIKSQNIQRTNNGPLREKMNNTQLIFGRTLKQCPEDWKHHARGSYHIKMWNNVYKMYNNVYKNKDSLLEIH